MVSWLLRPFSQTAQVRERKAQGLHPVNELQRFGLLVCCFFCSICVSLTFAFEILSTQFRTQFDLSSGDMLTISTVGLVFCYFLVPYSLIYEYFGPAVNFLICGATGLTGAVCLGLTFQGKMRGNLATITVFYALLNTAAGLFDVTYISVLFEVFPRNRGPVIGLAKVMTGLGTSILSCICNTLFESNLAGFVYFLAALISVVSVASALVVVLPPYHMNYWRRRGKTPEQLAELQSIKRHYVLKFVPKRRLFAGYIVVMCMIVFFAVEAPVLAYSKHVSRGEQVAVGIIAVLLALCLFIPMLPIPWLGGMNEAAPEGLPDGDLPRVVNGNSLEKAGASPLLASIPVAGPGSLSEDLDAAGLAGADKPVCDCDDSAAMSRQDPRYTAETIMDYFRAPELWLLLAYLACTQPMGILVSFNSSTISIALTGVVRSEGLSALYSAFLGVGNSIGRILFGLFEAHVQHQSPQNRKVLITHTLFVAPILISIAGILVQVMPGNSILLPYIVVYIQYGFNAALAALMFTSLFESFHNALYCIGFIVTVVCVIVFNRMLFGVWLDWQHERLKLSGSVECNQAVCVRMPLIVVAVLGACSFLLALVLHVRYSRYVRRIRGAALTDKSLATASEDAREGVAEEPAAATV